MGVVGEVNVSQGPKHTRESDLEWDPPAQSMRLRVKTTGRSGVARQRDWTQLIPWWGKSGSVEKKYFDDLK